MRTLGARNRGEGSRRVGRDRPNLYRIAAGSAEEVRVALWVARAWGYLVTRDGTPVGHVTVEYEDAPGAGPALYRTKLTDLAAVDGPLVEGTKDEALRRVASAEGIDLADVVAVGDGANDAPMLDAAGLAVGFRPKPAVRDHCDAVVDSMAELEALLRSAGVL